MEILPTHDIEGAPHRWCWSCQYAYPDNVSESNPEARCPSCSASQAVCERCGLTGAEKCIKSALAWEHRGGER